MSELFFENIEAFHISYSEHNVPNNMICSHYHNGYEFMLIMEGVRNIFYGDFMKTLRKGDFVIIRPFIPHYTETPEGQTFKRFLLNTSENYYDDILTDTENNDLFANIKTGKISLTNDDYNKILLLYEDMYEVLERKHTPSKLKLFKLRTACFIQEVGYISQKYSYDSYTKDVQGISLFNAIQYINKHYNEDITLDFIADYAHMSKSNFCLVFKKETGNTFLNYIHSLRCAKAHELLLNSNLSIGMTAEKTGFKSIQQMERMFKKIYGKSPREMKI